MSAVKAGLRRALLAAVASLVIAETVNGELTPLPPTPLVTAADGLYGSMDFAVAPNGSKVLFTAWNAGPGHPSVNGLYEAPIAGGSITPRAQLPSGLGVPVAGWGFSPNGTDVVFAQQQGFSAYDLFAMAVDGGDPRPLLPDHYGATYHPWWEPVFSQDGSRLLFHGYGPFAYESLFSIPLDGSAAITPLNEQLEDWRQSVNEDWKLLPNSNEVMFVAFEDETNGHNLFRVNTTGGAPQRVNQTDGIPSTGPLSHSFAIDAAGTLVAYQIHAGPAGRPTIMSRGLSGGPETELTPGLAEHDEVNIELHEFAQDQVVFEGNFSSPFLYDLYAASSDGGVKRIAESIAGVYRQNSAQVSPRGDAITFTANIGMGLEEIFLFDVATQSVRSLEKLPAGGSNPYIEYSSRGDHFLLSGKLFTAYGDFVRSLSGFSRFHPDGEHLFYTQSVPGDSGNRQELFMERLDGSGEAIHLSDDASAGPSVHFFTFGDAGSTLLYSRSQFGLPSELYAVRFVPEPAGVGMAVVAAAMVWLRRKGAMLDASPRRGW